MSCRSREEWWQRTSTCLSPTLFFFNLQEASFIKNNIGPWQHILFSQTFHGAMGPSEHLNKKSHIWDLFSLTIPSTQAGNGLSNVCVCAWLDLEPLVGSGTGSIYGSEWMVPCSMSAYCMHPAPSLQSLSCSSTISIIFLFFNFWRVLAKCEFFRFRFLFWRLWRGKFMWFSFLFLMN